MSQLSDYELKSIQKLESSIMEGKWSNEGMVRLIELLGDYLNLKSIPEYSTFKGKTYNGIKKTKKIRVILKHKFVIDNA
jgi:hypothetical protein